MKLIFGLFCVLCATGAFGQSTVGGAALSSEPRMISFPAHSARAKQQALALTQDLLEKTGFIVVKGDHPLEGIAPLPAPVVEPLGDTARMLRKEHEVSRKADVFWEN